MTPPSRWLTSEARRSLLALLPVLALELVVVRLAPDVLRGRTLALMLGVLCAYQLVWVVLTGVLLGHPWERLRAWAESTPEPSWRSRYLYVSQPGAGLAVFVSVLALAGVVAMVTRPEEVPGATSLAICAALLVTSWVSMLLSFTLDYLCTDARRGWTQLEIPGIAGVDDRRMSDYLYFSTAVSTTFGTTDVTVLSRPLRRTVTQHALIAFAFNTVILALALGLITA